MRRPLGSPTMTSMDPEDIPVLIAGAGPAGLAAAVELGRHGIPVLLVERRTALSSHPRATVLSLRSMELMRAWGLEDRVRARSADVEFSMLEADTLAGAAAGEAIEVGYPSRAQSRGALRRRRRRRAERAATRGGGADARRPGRARRRHDADPGAALGRRRAAPPPPLLAHPHAERAPAHRGVRPLAVRGPGDRRSPARGTRPRGGRCPRPARPDRAITGVLVRRPAR